MVYDVDSNWFVSDGYPRERMPAGGTLASAIAAWRADFYSGSGDWQDLTGNGFALRKGSSSGVDVNDPVFLAAGPYVYLPGVASNFLTTPDAAAYHFVGDLDVRLAIAMNDWTPATFSTFMTRFQAVGNNRAFDFLTDQASSGLFALNWSNDGIAQNVVFSTAAPVVVDGALLLVRVTLDVDDGAGGHAVTFYTKSSAAATAYADLRNNSGWVQLGAVVSGAGVTSLFPAIAPLEIGYGTGSGFPIAGKVYAAALLDGINGTVVFAADFTSLAAYDATRSTMTAATGQTVTVTRSGTALKSSVADRALWLLGGNKYFEYATLPAAAFDMAAADPFTAFYAFRFYGATIASSQIEKQASGAGPGWSINTAVAVAGLRGVIRDSGATTVTVDSATAMPVGSFFLGSLKRDPQVRVYSQVGGAAELGAVDTTTLTLAAPTTPFRLGASGAASPTLFAACELFAAGVFRSIQTDAQLVAIAAELGVT